jgi:hypothetical protein
MPKDPLGFLMRICHLTPPEEFLVRNYTLNRYCARSQVVNTLDLSYYPSDRGPYNNSSSVAVDPRENFGGSCAL